jgi:hypothetical protein
VLYDLLSLLKINVAADLTPEAAELHDVIFNRRAFVVKL